MAGTQNPNVDPKMIEQTRKHINRLREEVARLSETEIPPAEYFSEFLMRVLQALAAPAGAIWVRTPHGNLQLQAQVQIQKVGLDSSDESKETHTELLRQAVQQARPLVLQPQSSMGAPQGQGPTPGNPTDFLLLLAPIMMGNQVSGLIEIWQDPGRHPSAVQGFLQFIVHMSELASRYMRNRLLGDMLGQQELWTKMEVFSRQIHESLNPVEVAYRIANEGRRLIDCDRVSVGVRYGKKVVVEAVSGADIVEKRSNLVQRMRTLFDKVLAWGEKLVYTGTKDESLPEDVHKALDAYLEESNSKVLCILPLRDEREKDPEKDTTPDKPPRSVMLMECFESAQAPDQLIARMEVLGRHSASAMYNSVEHRRIPFRFVWMPLARIQEGLGGKARAIMISVALGLLLLVGLMYFVPYPLKMDATGQLMPEDRRWVFAPWGGRILRFNVEAGNEVGENQNLVLMYNNEITNRLTDLEKEINGIEGQINGFNVQLSSTQSPLERGRISTEMRKLKANLDAKVSQRDSLASVISIVPDQKGQFWLRSPQFPHDGANRDAAARWTVLNWDYKEKMTDAGVKPSDPILRLGYCEGLWEVVLKIPQKHIGQVLMALDRMDQEKRTQIANLLEKALTSPKPSLSKSDLAEWLQRDALAEVLEKAKVVDQGFSVGDLDKLSADQLKEKVDKVSVASLLDPLSIRSLQVRARSSGVLNEQDHADLLKESELDVDLLVKSRPTEVFKGKLARSKIAGAADQHRDDNNEAEPVVVARVRITGEGIDPSDQIPRELLLTDTQVNAKVRCGSHRMGYSLFYGVWEFLYEKVVFFF